MPSVNYVEVNFDVPIRGLIIDSPLIISSILYISSSRISHRHETSTKDIAKSILQNKFKMQFFEEFEKYSENSKLVCACIRLEVENSSV